MPESLGNNWLGAPFSHSRVSFLYEQKTFVGLESFKAAKDPSEKFRVLSDYYDGALEKNGKKLGIHSFVLLGRSHP